MTRVSVVIPTLLRPQMVIRAIASVLRQTIRDIEVIVVVDGDDPEALQALGATSDPRVRVKTLSSHVGTSGARNAGVAEAQARWIAFLDDDDEWFPNKLERQLRTAEQASHPHPIVSCRLIARSEEGDLIWPRRAPASDEPLSEYLFCQRGLRGGEGLILPSTVLTTRELMRRIPFREDLPRHNDVDWLLRAAAFDDVTILFVPDREPLIVWNVQTNRSRISNTSDWRYSLNWMQKNRGLVTARAYASFLLIWTSLTAARGGHWTAFWILPREAWANGKPRFSDVLAHVLIWLVPNNVRNRISVFLDRKRTSARHDLHDKPT